MYMLWFAFKLVSLIHWKQLIFINYFDGCVVICFQISIFDSLKTAFFIEITNILLLWFAFKLVSLIHWKQQLAKFCREVTVVICFQISIFDSLKTAILFVFLLIVLLWFAFKLVSLIHWKQPASLPSAGLLCCDLLSN